MQLTGSEIDGFLEHAVGNWYNTLSGSNEHLLLFDEERPGRLAHPYYNFSSAAGIGYYIDLSQEPGNRVEILGFSDGSPFKEEATYQVALNSYRGNGGGGHLTQGAGIPRDSLPSRVTWSSDRDLRYYLMEYLGKHDTLHPARINNWKCVPEERIKKAAMSDRILLEKSLGFRN